MQRFSRLLRNAVVAVASLGLGLVMAEGLARMAHRGAFPYLNVFVPDPVMGVRLQPGAHARLRTRLGHLSAVEINPQGFRGPDFTTMGRAGRVLLLGDSQVFGYHVAQDQAMAAQLSRVSAGRLGGMAAAVPTWGPHESVQAARELVPQFRPAAVVFFANVANDWLEAPVRNIKRTTAQHGWPTVVAHAAHAQQASGLTDWLLGQSHLVYTVKMLTQARRVLGAPPAVAAQRMMRSLSNLERAVPPWRSRLSPHLDQVKALCAEQGCAVLAAILPMDVQVHAGEWRKYRTRPQDLSPLNRLTQAFGADANAMGVEVVDLTAALTAASPGAWLEDDDHLSAAGHTAVATALASRLNPLLAGALP